MNHNKGSHHDVEVLPDVHALALAAPVAPVIAPEGLLLGIGLADVTLRRGRSDALTCIIIVVSGQGRNTGWLCGILLNALTHPRSKKVGKGGRRGRQHYSSWLRIQVQLDDGNDLLRP